MLLKSNCSQFTYITRYLALLLILTFLSFTAGCSFYIEKKECIDKTNICFTNRETNWPITVFINSIFFFGIIGTIAEQIAKINQSKQKALAKNVVDFLQKIDTDNQLKQQVIQVQNLDDFLKVAATNGYCFTEEQLHFMVRVFAQEVEAMSRTTDVIKIIGQEKFGDGELDRIQGELLKIKNHVSFISKFMSITPPLPRRKINIPYALVKHLSKEKQDILKSLDVDFE